ncbi:MAG: endonuclease/exonuclease/phosphatase family protein [Patescibacteria group bacterium]
MFSRSLELVSVNMALDHGDPEERWRLFETACLELPRRPDIIAIQEVAWEPGAMALNSLRLQLGSDYKLELGHVYEGQEDQKGAAVLTRVPIKTSQTVALKGTKKHAQVVGFGGEGASNLVLANLHLEASPKDELRRAYKLAELVDYLEAGYGLTPQAIAGDFNALPWFPSVRMMRLLGFKSAFEAVHGSEASHTYPTPLSAEEMLTGNFSMPHQFRSLRTAARILSAVGVIGEHQRSASGLTRYPVDFVFTKGTVAPLDAGLIHDDTNGRRPFSDHYGIRTTLQLA